MREKSLFLFDPAVFRDVHEEADGTADSTVSVEQRRGIFPQRQMGAVGPDDVDDRALHLDTGPGRLNHGAVVACHRTPIRERFQRRGREWRVAERDLTAGLEAKVSCKRGIHSRRSAEGIVGNRDSDRQQIKQRFDDVWTLAQIQTELPDELERMGRSHGGRRILRPLISELVNW